MKRSLSSRGLGFVILFGMAFSGYLTSSVMLSATCPLSGGCMKVLGYPSCMYGFIMYSALMGLLLLTWRKKIEFAAGQAFMLLTATIGAGFSGSILLFELASGSPVTICAAGFTMFLIILVLTGFWREEHNSIEHTSRFPSKSKGRRTQTSSAETEVCWPMHIP